jgi:uncharacterized protein (TIGR02246 family)
VTVGAVEDLYRRLLRAWNDRDARGWATLFTEDGTIVGFDGSPVDTRAEIEAHLRQIFDDHQPAAYVAKVREVRPLGDDVTLLRSVAAMVPPGSSEVEPALNTVQSLVAVRLRTGWKVAHFQSTPAAFDGRPEALDALTEELQAEVGSAGR